MVESMASGVISCPMFTKYIYLKGQIPFNGRQLIPEYRIRYSMILQHVREFVENC